MKTIAAILVETGHPLVLDEIELPALKPGQTIVEVSFSGVCRTQVLQWRGFRGHDPFLPHCLGHEGSGVVREIGPGVTKVKVGDQVILSWIKGSGQDVPGSIYLWGKRNVNSGAVTTFNRLSVVSENRLTALPKGYSLEEAAHLGCTVATGVGSVFNTADAKSGNSLAVFGSGGVGLCSVAAAKIKGCTPIIALDINPDKLKLAVQMGATHTIQINGGDPVKGILQICPKGVDIAVEASGQPSAMNQSLLCIRAQGGNVVLIGNAKEGTLVQFDPKEFNQGKRFLGTWGGDNWPDRDFPKYLELIKSGQVNLSLLTTRSYGLNHINEAMEALDAGKVARPLIDMSLT